MKGFLLCEEYLYTYCTYKDESYPIYEDRIPLIYEEMRECFECEAKG
jgi:hypothetical protein